MSEAFRRACTDRNCRVCGVIGLVAVALLRGPARAETAVATAPATRPTEETPKKAPRYLNLRFDEDFSYLDGPADSYEHDFFDPLKYIHVTDDLTVTTGGEFRARLEAETDKHFGAGTPSQDTFFLHRTFVHADIRYQQDTARLFVQGVNAMVEDRDLSPSPIFENRFDFHQLFADVRAGQWPLYVRVGRQELLYGAERLISPLDWANTRRRFDGAKAFWRGQDLDVDAWYAHPVPVRLADGYNRQLDHYAEDSHFYGLYTTWRFQPKHGVDAYFLGLRDTEDQANANGRTGDLSLYTLGSRFWGASGQVDYETELAGQWGKWAGDTIQAWAWSVTGGYTVAACPATPRVGLGFDMATGDRDPTDRVHQTFHQLFPFSHAYFGYLDLVARQNILSPHVSLKLKPLRPVVVGLAYHLFWTYTDADALYNAAGTAIRRDPSGQADRFIGRELDLTVTWTIDRHQSVLVGYSHLWTGEFVSDTGSSEDPSLFYVQYTFRF